MFIVATLLRSMVEYSVKLFSSTMLNQTYEHLSAVLSNLLSVFILISGMSGTFLVKKLVFPRLIKNEILCYTLILALSIPFVVFLLFIGKVPVWSIVLSLCMINMLMSATLLLLNFFNIRYTRYRLNGTAAGIINAAASFGIALQHCLFGTIADNLGWQTVTVVLIILTVLATLCISFSIKPATKFIKSVTAEK
jgi:sugar phosphate permease